MRSLASLAVVCFLSAETAADGVSVTTMLDGLQSPSGVAIRPETGDADYEVYVADAAAGRVVRVRSGQPGTGEDAITGFPAQAANDNHYGSAGPHGLLFLDRRRLVVSGSGTEGRPFIRLYELSDSQPPLAADGFEQHVEPPADEEQPKVTGFLAMSRTLANANVADMLVVAGSGKQAAAGIWKVPIRAGTLAEIERFALTRPGGEPAAPRGIAVGPHGYIVLSEKSEQETNVSRLKFLSPIDASMALQVTCDLPAVVGLAYSPQSGNLYAAVPGASDGEAGGIYRIDDAGEPGKPACAVAKIADAHRPTALAFGSDGALYVTALGEPGDDETNTGVLLKLSGDL
jgi:hypothetical protein